MPGNPLSAFVTWQIVGTSLVRRLTGRTTPLPLRRHVATQDTIRRKPDRCEIRPATIVGCDDHGREVVRFEDTTHSGRVPGLPEADGLMLLPADADHLPAGVIVEFQPFCDT